MVNDLATLTETSDALITTTPQGAVVCWTPGAQHLFGYSGEEAAGRLLAELIGPIAMSEDEARREQEMLRLARAEGGVSYAAMRRTRDGALVYVDSSSKAIRDQGGNIEYIVWSNRDVTQLKVQRDAKWAEEKFGDVLELTPDAIVMANACGRIVLANSQADALFGYDRGELRGCLLESLMPPRLRRAHLQHRAVYAGNPQSRPMGAGRELYGLRKSGEEFPVEISLRPMPSGEAGMVVSAIRDTSERRRIERALHEKNLELENANRAKDHFLAGMSHELRTPLNAIIGFTGTLLMRLPGPLNADQFKQLNMVQSSARHLLSLINDLLDLTKIEAGKVELAIESLACRPLIEELLLIFRPEARKKGLQLKFEWGAMPSGGAAARAAAPAGLAASAVAQAGADLTVAADRRALQQILMNLLNNAIKFTDSGEVSVVLRAVRTGQRDSVAISVSDTGVGIGSEDQARLFQAFTQLDARPGRLAQGTGLGLHLSQKLARLMNGWIAVESEHGTGSVFTLVLPLE